MPQSITPIVNACQINAIRIDVDAGSIALDYSQGIADETNTYQPIHRLSKTIEGEAFAALGARAMRLEDSNSMQVTNLYSLIKTELYQSIL